MVLELPPVSDLHRISRALAILDCILEPEWEYRYYSFNARWPPTSVLASMRDGSGDSWFLLLHALGWAGLQGFVHESPAATIPNLGVTLQQSVPEMYGEIKAEPVLGWGATTFCFWHPGRDANWETPARFANLDTGADDLLKPFVTGPKGYQEFAREYYERETSLSAIAQIFQHQSLDGALVAALNPEVALTDIAAEIATIGYP